MHSSIIIIIATQIDVFKVIKNNLQSNIIISRFARVLHTHTHTHERIFPEFNLSPQMGVLRAQTRHLHSV